MILRLPAPLNLIAGTWPVDCSMDVFVHSSRSMLINESSSLVVLQVLSVLERII